MKHFLLEFLENLPLLNRYEAKAACDDILGYLEPLADHMADEVPALLLTDPTAQHYDPDRGFWVAPHSKQWFWWNELNGYQPGTFCNSPVRILKRYTTDGQGNTNSKCITFLLKQVSNKTA